MSSKDKFKEILALDLQPIKIKLMHVESGEGWSQQKADAVEAQYKRFLCLIKKFPNQQMAPLVDVDTFWHYHILDTMKYAVDCEAVFGYFLHHYPYLGMGAEDDEAAREQGASLMAELYEETFGESFTEAVRRMNRVDAAFCAAPSESMTSAVSARASFCAAPSKAGSGATAAFCAAPSKPAFCAAPSKPAAGVAFCAAPAKPAFCAAPSKPAASVAFCAAPAKPAFRAAPSKSAASIAFCAAPAKPAFCAAPSKPAASVAFCAAPAKPAFCAAPSKSASSIAFCAAPAKPAFCAAAGKLADSNAVGIGKLGTAMAELLSIRPRLESPAIA